MKSMSIRDHGSDTFACVCRWSRGLRSASNPPIHIFAGEKVCIQATTPMHSSDAVASRHARRIASAVVRTGRQTRRTPSCSESTSAISRDWSSTWRSVSSPYRAWLPVRNQISTSSWLGMRSPRVGCWLSSLRGHVGGALAVDVLVAVVQVVDVVLLGSYRVAELPRDVHAAGDVLTHHGRLHRGLRVLADG